MIALGGVDMDRKTMTFYRNVNRKHCVSKFSTQHRNLSMRRFKGERGWLGKELTIFLGAWRNKIFASWVPPRICMGIRQRASAIVGSRIKVQYSEIRCRDTLVFRLYHEETLEIVNMRAALPKSRANRIKRDAPFPLTSEDLSLCLAEQ